MSKKGVYRMDIWSVDIKESDSEKFYGVRPAICISYWKNNCKNSLIQIIPITSKDKRFLSTNIKIEGYGLDKDSTIICNQILTVSKKSLIKKIGHISDLDLIHSINKAIEIQLQLDGKYSEITEIEELKDFLDKSVEKITNKKKFYEMKCDIFEAHKRKEYQSVLKTCDKLIKEIDSCDFDEKNSILWFSYYYKANALDELEQWDLAISNIKLSLKYIGKLGEISENHTYSLFVLGRCYWNIGDIENALILYNNLCRYYAKSGNTIMRISVLFNKVMILKNVNRLKQLIKITESLEYKEHKIYKPKEDLLREMRRDLKKLEK